MLFANPATASSALVAYAQAFALGLGLIVAIGAQNAFVLRQGLRRQHVGAVVLLCALLDALLIAAGVLGLGQLLGARRELARALAWLGAIFLAAYGAQALRRAWRGSAAGLRPESSAADPPDRRGPILAQAAAFTLLNPHVYLDTVLLLGSIGAQQPTAGLRGVFIAGACSASVLWFAALGYGARLLTPWFARPRAWQVLDGIIGVTMLGLAAGVLMVALDLR